MNNSLWRTMLPALMGGPEAPDPATHRAYAAAAADPKVQALTAACVLELTRLVQDAGTEHFLHAAVMGAATLDGTPAGWLETQLGMLRAEIELARKERLKAKERWHADAESRRPLVEAANRVDRAGSMERQSLIARLDALRSNGPRKTRWTELREAGLSEAQILALDLPPHELDEQVQAQACRDRLAELDAQLARIAAYGNDPLHDAEHLRGLGFDNLVDAQIARTTVAV